MELKDGIKQRVDEVRNLPIWIQYAVAIITILGPLIGWGLSVALPLGGGFSGSCKVDGATTTLNVSDILSRLDDIDRAVDRQDFLQRYLNVPVCGTSWFDNISRSGERTYYLHLYTFRGSVSCEFVDINEDTERKLNLLQKGDRVLFSGVFTGSSLFGGGGWYIKDCKLIE